ncbi:MAG TPA: GMC oxidoreductase [Stellaceae bacterium]|jgi:choline dehydrogenase-like flavoprotein
MIAHGIPPRQHGHHVIVVGAGPAGIVQALELRRHGIPVTMLAGGGDGLDTSFQAMADAEIADPRRHAPMEVAVRRAFGGTSSLWGGRCVAFDEGDFARGWPIGEAEIAPWYGRAIRYLDAGEPEFSAPLATTDPECRFDELERWSEGRDLRRIHAAALEGDPGLQVQLGVVCTGLEIDAATGKVTGVAVASRAGERAMLTARAVVLACGGLETTRLMLATQAAHPWMFGGAEGPLGRYYMGHLEGRIAEIAFAQPGADRAFDFFVDASSRYVRRRITIPATVRRQHELLNLCAWPDNPALKDPGHKSAILSLAYLSLAAPGLGGLLAPEGIRRKHLDGGVAQIPRHLGNVVRGTPEAVREATRYLYRRYAARPHLPGFFIPNAGRRYALFYHAEQAPNRDSRVRLAGTRDALGMPRLKIDLRYGEIDARSVVASHAIIDRGLRRSGLGRLDYTVPESGRLGSIMDQATDGYHQIGTARMAEDPRAGVVDGDCRVHGSANLFVASSAVFPSSGQANPTLLLTALSARLAAHLAAGLASLPEEPPFARARQPALVPAG